MIRTKVFPELLQQADKDGVKGTIILKQSDGSVLAASGHQDRCHVLAAIVSSVFSQYSAGGTLTDQILYCDEGCVYVLPLHGYLLCLYGDVTAPAGLMRKKASLLAESLAAPLGQISAF